MRIKRVNISFATSTRFEIWRVGCSLLHRLPILISSTAKIGIVRMTSLGFELTM